MKKPKVTFTVEMHEETTFLPADGSNWSLHLIRLEDGGMASGAYIGQHCEATASMIAKDLAETVGGELVRLNAVELHARRVERLRGAIARYRDQYIPCHESRLLTPDLSYESREFWTKELDKARAELASREAELAKLEREGVPA